MPKQIKNLVLYDVIEISKMLDIQPATVRKYFRLGKFHGKKLARKWYTTEENLKSYFSEIPAE